MQGMIPDIHSKSFWKLKYLVEEFLNKINKRIPFLALTETWLKSHIKDAQIAIPQYQIVRADREGRERGGALLYIYTKISQSSMNKYLTTIPANWLYVLSNHQTS